MKLFYALKMITNFCNEICDDCTHECIKDTLFQAQKLKIVHGDCLQYLSKFPDNYFDLAIVDPPYGIGINDSINYNEERAAKQLKRGYKKHVHKEWDSDIPTSEYFIELFRVSKNQIIWGGNYMTEHLKPSRCWIIWDKLNPTFTAINNEMAWTSFTKKVSIFKRSISCENGFNAIGGHIHPTQKPVALYKWLLDKYAKPNDKILDTHLGSGSIAIACHDYGFDLTACELDKEYFDSAMKRIDNHVAQQKLNF